MKIDYFEDVAAPAEFVFRRVTDFAQHERRAVAQGASVRRLDGATEGCQGAAWQIGFSHRGRARDLRAEITTWAPPHKAHIDAVTGGLDIHLVVGVVALSSRLTRINVSINLMPRSITARLLVQSLKLTRGTVTARLQARLTTMGEEIAGAWARQQGQSIRG